MAGTGTHKKEYEKSRKPECHSCKVPPDRASFSAGGCAYTNFIELGSISLNSGQAELLATALSEQFARVGG